MTREVSQHDHHLANAPESHAVQKAFVARQAVVYDHHLGVDLRQVVAGWLPSGIQKYEVLVASCGLNGVLNEVVT